MKKYNIAVIGLKGLPAFGGAATVGENIIEQLKDKFEFTVYAISSHTEQQSGKFNGYNQIVFRKAPFKKLNIYYYYLLSVLHCLIFGRYDLIHIHSYLFFTSLQAALLKKVKKFPLVLQLHGFQLQPSLINGFK